MNRIIPQHLTFSVVNPVRVFDSQTANHSEARLLTKHLESLSGQRKLSRSLLAGRTRLTYQVLLSWLPARHRRVFIRSSSYRRAWPWQMFLQELVAIGNTQIRTLGWPTRPFGHLKLRRSGREIFPPGFSGPYSSLQECSPCLESQRGRSRQVLLESFQSGRPWSQRRKDLAPRWLITWSASCWSSYQLLLQIYRCLASRDFAHFFRLLNCKGRLLF